MPADRPPLADETEEPPPWDVPGAAEERDDQTFSMFGEETAPQTPVAQTPIAPTPASLPASLALALSLIHI